MTEQRYNAVQAVIGDGRTVTEVARDLGVSRQTLHVWLARYEEEGLEGLSNRSHRPAHSPHQMPAVWEAKVLEMRRGALPPAWGKGGEQRQAPPSLTYRSQRISRFAGTLKAGRLTALATLGARLTA